MSLTAKKVYAILNGKIVKINGIIETIKHPVIYQGSVKNESELPQKTEIGWMYNIQEKSSYGEAGMNVVWTKDGWDAMGAMIDTSLFLEKTDLADWAKQPQKPSYTAKEVGALPENVLIPTKLSELTGDTTHRTVTDAEKNNWNKVAEISSDSITFSINTAKNCLQATYGE